MCDSIGIGIAKTDITDELIDHIILLDNVGKISLDTVPTRLTHETWVEALERQDHFSKERYSNLAKINFDLPSHVIDETDHVYFTGESRLSDKEFIVEFAGFKKEVSVWFESCDGYNATELTIFEDGTHKVYDVDYEDSVSFIQADAIHLIRNYPAAAFKTVVLELLQETRYNDKSKYLKPFPDVLPKHQVAHVLGQLDEGELQPSEALDLIKEINKPVINDYMVLVDSDYCDGQAIITKSEGEFGGDGYVELSRTYPICAGTYRGESPEQAIKQAAEQWEASEEIFTAVQIQK